jgi:hypothetical protein
MTVSTKRTVKPAAARRAKTPKAARAAKKK